jgi:glycosyltransferase involved in cell wall biosynthesis
MKKILIIDLGAVWGGQEIYSDNLVNELILSGFSVSHASSQLKHNKENIAFYHIGFSKSKLIGNIILLNNLIGQNDVIIFNGNRAIQQSFFLVKKKKFFAIKHGPFSVTTQNGFKLKLVRFIYFILFRKIDKLICVAKVTFDECKTIANKESFFIPNGVKSNNVFKPKNFSKGIKAVYCGRLVEEKGVRILFEVVNTIHKKNTVGLVFDVFGEGPLFDWCIKFITENSLTNVIRMRGYVSNNELIYSDANLLLFASKHEGMPLSILEAFSYGIPVLAYSAPGVKDLIKNGENGFLVVDDKFSPNTMALKLTEIIQQDSLDGISTKVKSDFEKQYSFEKMYNNICQKFELL